MFITDTVLPLFVLKVVERALIPFIVDAWGFWRWSLLFSALAASLPYAAAPPAFELAPDRMPPRRLKISANGLGPLSTFSLYILLNRGKVWDLRSSLLSLLP